MNHSAKNAPPSSVSRTTRRRLLLGSAAASAGLAAPWIWIPKPAFAQTSARGSVKHLIYIRLSGGFRFTAAFNGNVAAEFNPFGRATNLPSGTEWSPSTLVATAPWLEGDMGQPLVDLGMRPVTSFAGDIALMATVDHEPFAGSADGNHGTGLERYHTGYAAGENGFFTMLNYGVRERITAAATAGEVLLPPFVLGGAGIALGTGQYAAYRPPLIQGDNLDGFAFETSEALPAWANQLSLDADEGYRQRMMIPLRPSIEAYQGTRESTRKFAEIFGSDALQIQNGSGDLVDGVSNRELASMFGDSGAGRRLRLALRLFSYGAPAVFLDQGGYDLHSGEEERLPLEMAELNRLVSALHAALHRMTHPDGGSYWDHSLVVLGSEFGRTTRGGRFNSAAGSDHGGDRATRWMSMPFMGGVIDRLGLAGRTLGSTRASDLQAQGEVYSYRAVLKTLMDLLGADHDEFFPADVPLAALF